jgi:hypothetical protein
VNAVSGERSRATVLLMRADMTAGDLGAPASYSPQSESGGQFTFKGIESGAYRLIVNRNGNASFTYESRGPRRPGTTMSSHGSSK